MTLDQLPGRASVFLDANTFVYFFAADPVLGPSCERLFTRIQSHEIDAHTSTHVLSEVAHRLMILEAAVQFGWPSKIVPKLKRQPDCIAQLQRFRTAMEQVPQLGVRVLTIDSPLIPAAAGISQHCGLLTNDALIIAVMQASGLTNLASGDRDFDRVPGITRYEPT
jgi:predicted nucleic acid-binding protein